MTIRPSILYAHFIPVFEGCLLNKSGQPYMNNVLKKKKGNPFQWDYRLVRQVQDCQCVHTIFQHGSGAN